MVVAGAEVWNSAVSGVESYRTQTGATHPLLLNGYLPMRNSYDAGKNEYFIIDQNGIIQFHDSLGSTVWTWMVDTLINRMTATIDLLLGPYGISRTPDRALNGFQWYFPGGNDLFINLEKSECFSINLFDVRGRSLGRMPEQPWPAGEHRLQIGMTPTAGMRFVILNGPGFHQVIRAPISR